MNVWYTVKKICRWGFAPIDYELANGIVLRDIQPVMVDLPDTLPVMGDGYATVKVVMKFKYPPFDPTKAAR
jgi:hypothetical protein